MKEIGLKRLVQQSGLYFLANVSLKLAGLILYVFYLSQLSQTSIGHFGLLDATAKMALLLGGLGVAQGLIKYMTDASVAEVHAELPFTALVASGATALGAFGVFWVFAPWLAGFLVDDPTQVQVVHWLGAYVAFKVVGAVPMTVFRIQERVGWYVLATAAELALLVGGVYYFLMVRHLGLLGIYYAFAGSAGLTAVCIVGVLISRCTLRFNSEFLRRMLVFGMPLIAATLASSLLNVGDRYLIKALMDADAVALYDLAARIGGVFNLLIVQSFQLAFVIIGLKSLTQSEAGPRFYQRTFHYYVVGAGWAVLGLSLLALDLIRLIPAQDNYEAAHVLVFPYVLGFLFYGIYYIVMNVLYGFGASGTITLLILSAALLNIALNLLLIPLYGTMGAALATLASYAVLAGITHFAAQRYLIVHYKWPVLAKVLVLVVLLYFLAQPSADWSTWPRLGTRLGLLLAYPLLVLLLRLLPPSKPPTTP